MAPSDDDDDLKRAIAMSLAEASSPIANVAKLASDDEDEEMRHAIALSLQDSNADPGTLEATVSHPPEYAFAEASQQNKRTQCRTENASSTSASSKPSGLFGLDRKAMEEERLARLGKRKRSASPERPSKLITKTPGVSNADEKSRTSCNGPNLKYPKGTVKRTWAFKHPRTDDIKIEEVLQASTVNIAVLSAFQWEDNWLFDKMTPEITKQIWIMSAKGEDVQSKMRREAVACGIPNFKQHFPPMNGQIMNMHSKLMLLFHKDYLRIVIPTANMIAVDWGETNKDPRTGESWQPAVMENTVFLIDLPRRPDGKPAEEAETAFGKELVYFLTSQELGRNVLEGLLKHNFSETKHLRFVHSIGGNHSGKDPNRHRTGLPGLALGIHELGLDQVKTLEIDYAASSLGALKEPFLKQIYLAACGISPLSEDKAPADFLDRFRIYFPTKETVVNSTGGARCGGIITLARAHYDSPGFPKQCMRDYVSTRKGVLSHNKLLLARGRKNDGKPFAWAYIGSANISESAWGAPKILKNGKESLNIRNWECGVIVPVPDEALEKVKLADDEVPPMSVFEGTVEVPFQYPGEKYEGREPWFSKG